MGMTTDATSAIPDAAAPVRAGGTQARPGTGSAGGGTGQAKSAAKAGDTVELSPEAAAQVTKLKARDADVRAHEEAHVAAGGSLITGGPTYSYQRGPDGKSYAVGGDVTIDTSAVAGNPKATLAKARQIVAAALAANAQAQVSKAAGAGSGTKPATATPGSLLDVTG